MKNEAYIGNSVIDRLPTHLKRYIKPQNYDSYSPIDQAVWRYVMRKNVHQLKDTAHPSYLRGLRETGIDIEQIPNMYGMNRILKKIGWAAVAVDGFIPPAAFMDFQAYNVLVIAADIRQLEHIEYTPAPDIIHESAGHAPIIANPEYSEFLRHFGEIGSKAISNHKDYELYEAIRHLSIIKEAPNTSKDEVQRAKERIATLSASMGEPSEMALLRRLHWWTVEYGLIGTLEKPKIYGAGLLSSIGEAQSCLKGHVKKLPLTKSAVYQDYDITKPQPQLFVTPDFAHLSQVLEEFAQSLAMRSGGLDGISKLIDSRSLGTIELSTGLQISGVFHEVIAANDRAIYITTHGSAALASREKELIGHGIAKYPTGFASPVGRLKGINLAIEDMSPRDLKAYGIYEGEKTRLEFEGGINVEGEVITGMRNLQGKIMLVSFKNCMVSYHEQILFTPADGIYHMAVGKEVISAFNGAADLNSFQEEPYLPSEETIRVDKSEKRLALEELYLQVRKVRQCGKKLDRLPGIFDRLKKDHPEDWLLAVEMYELTSSDTELHLDISSYLEKLKTLRPDLKHLISDGQQIVDFSKTHELVNK